MRFPAAPPDLRRIPAVVLLLGLLIGCGQSVPPPEAEEPSDQVLEQITRTVEGGRVHLVALVQRGDRHAFDPAEVTIASGDVVRFVMAGPQPESIAFDPAGATPEAARYIRENSLHLGGLLTDPGQAYDVSFADAPAGEYPFFSRPHVSTGMGGLVVVRD